MLGSLNLGLGSVLLAGEEDPSATPPPSGDFLSTLYAAGLLDDPSTHNRLVGSAFNTFFRNEGSVEISQTAAGSFPLFLRRAEFIAQGTNRPALQLITKYAFGGGTNVLGGSGFDVVLEDENGNPNGIVQWQGHQDTNISGEDHLYSPFWTAAPSAFSRYLMSNRRNAGPQVAWSWYASGTSWVNAVMDESVARKQSVLTASMAAVDPFNAPKNGSALGFRVTGPAARPDFGFNAEIGSMFAVLDTADFGSTQATGHWDVYASGPTLPDGPALSASFYPTSFRVAKELTQQGGNIVPFVLESDEIDFTAAAPQTVNFPNSTIPGKSLMFSPNANLVRSRITAVAGTLTTQPLAQLGNNVAVDNIANTPAVAITNAQFALGVGAWASAIGSNATFADIPLTTPVQVKITTAAAGVGTTLRGRIYIPCWLVNT